jgi:hypothetical protein
VAFPVGAESLSTFSGANGSLKNVAPFGEAGIDGSAFGLERVGEQFGRASSGAGDGREAAKSGPNVFRYIEVKTLPETAEGYFFFACRGANPGASWNGYGFIFIRTGTSTWVNQVRRYTAGASTTLGANNTTAIAVGDKIGFSAEGKVLKLWREASGSGTWTLLAEREDATYSAEGYCAYEVSGNTGRYDNLEGATISGTSPANLVLGASVGVASATVALKAPTRIPLNVSVGVATASLALTSPTSIPLAPSAGIATPTLALSVPTPIPLGASAGESSATLAVTTPTPAAVIPLGASAGSGSAMLAMAAPTTVATNTSVGVGAATLGVEAPTLIACGPASGVGTAGLTLQTPTAIPAAPSSGSGTATIALTAPTTVELAPSAGTSGGFAVLTAPAGLALGPTAGVATAKLALTAGHHLFSLLIDRPVFLDLAPHSPAMVLAPHGPASTLADHSPALILDPRETEVLLDG